MAPQTTGILIGGLIPALLYGLSGVFSKASTKAGIGLGIYLFIAGITIAIIGVGFYLYLPDKTVSMRSASYSVGLGISWGLGTGLVAIALTKYSIPLGKLVPLYNMNTLIAVVLALWIFSEWQQVKITQLLIGAVLIVAGGILVSKA